MNRRRNVRVGRVTVHTTESDKVLAVHEKSQAIGEFLEWLRADGYVLSKPHRHEEGCVENGMNYCGYQKDSLVPVYEGIEALLARYFKIDLNERERELRALLAAIRTREFESKSDTQ